jgi:hypothetical protein
LRCLAFHRRLCQSNKRNQTAGQGFPEEDRS